MIDCFKKFKSKFEVWVVEENKRRKKNYEEKFQKAIDKSKIRPFTPYDKFFFKILIFLEAKLYIIFFWKILAL